MGPVGSDVRIELADGGTLTGRVLARTGTEVALSWREIDGVCELKTSLQGPDRVASIRGFGWGMSQEDAAALEARMEQALERLDGRTATA